MPKKNNSIFVCQECGHESPKWMGQCICGAWNSYVEEKTATQSAEDDARSRTRQGKTKGSAVKLSQINSGNRDRLDTGIEELNRVLGGGLVRGSLTLIAGEPGIGKSTLILQTAIELSKRYGRVLYVTGEESEEQIRIRADRVSDDLPAELLVIAETNIDNIVALSENPVFLIIDSIQTMYTDALESAAGSVSQIRACAAELMRIAKVSDIPVFIVAHVTKSGDLAGPKIIEHLVDCVLQFTGDRSRDLRILRANKNRFGTTSEIGAFEMQEEGLVQIHDLSGSLLEDMENAAEGAIATAVYEGTRPLLLEMQALTSTAGVGFARRTSIGIEVARLNMILAVIERKVALDLSNKDVYLNVVGGIKPEGTSADLAAALAIWSSARSISIDPHTLAIGEIGLTGELRSVKGADRIIREAARLGFRVVILPKKNAEKIEAPKGLTLIGASNIFEAVQAL